MQTRFTLRFESGERAGETIPVPAEGMTVGRRPGNTLVIADASVSGRHAELLPEGEGLVLRDLGSTNGTRVGSQRVEEARPAHGDRILFGNVALVLADARLAGEQPDRGGAPRRGAAAPTPDASAAGEGVARLDAAKVLAGARRSKVGLVVLVLALAGAGAAAWLLLGGGETARTRTRPVEAVAGNLIGEDFSFEQGQADFEAAPGSSAFFERSPGARFSGAFGLRASLAGGERAQAAAASFAAREGSALRLAARLRAGEDAAGRVGIELLGPTPSGGGEPRSLVAFGPWIGDLAEHEAVEFLAPVPAGYERARVVVQAVAGPAGGRVDLDDVVLLATGSAPEPDARSAEYRLFLVGRPAQGAQLQKVARPVLGDLRVELEGAEGSLAQDVPLAVVQQDGRMRLTAQLPTGLPPGFEPRLALRGEEGAVSAGLATRVDGVVRARALEFEQEGVEALLFGDGPDLVGLLFPQPVRVRSRAQGGAAVLEVAPAPREFMLQLDFGPERARAGELAFAARNAQQQGRLGAALETWDRLLAETPFERRLVEEAEAARAQLVNAGLAELGEVERELERARFFRLADLYRRARQHARDVGARYAPSEVERRAAEVVAAVDLELRDLETDLARGEAERLGAIRAVLEAQGASSLAAAVGTYLDETFGGARR